MGRFLSINALFCQILQTSHGFRSNDDNETESESIIITNDHSNGFAVTISSEYHHTKYDVIDRSLYGQGLKCKEQFFF